jgi:hypothetical protein
MYMERHKMKISEKTFNLETGEETITERDATPEEMADHAKRTAEREAQIAADAQKAIAKAALLAQLGITEEQAKLLLN